MGPSWGHLEAILRPSRDHLGAIWEPSGKPKEAKARPQAQRRLGYETMAALAPLGLLGCTAFGTHWCLLGPPGASWGHIGTILEPSRGVLGAIFRSSWNSLSFLARLLCAPTLKLVCYEMYSCELKKQARAPLASAMCHLERCASNTMGPFIGFVDASSYAQKCGTDSNPEHT